MRAESKDEKHKKKPNGRKIFDSPAVRGAADGFKREAARRDVLACLTVSALSVFDYSAI
jgi:hypothetical protein